MGLDSTVTAAANDFDVWGCRGSRSLPSGRSAIGSYTSCYSLLDGDELYVIDAGRGLTVLGEAMLHEPRLQAVRRVHVLVSHAHLDHWEGLKDVDWFWTRGNGLDVTLHGAQETLDAIRGGFAHPTYVPLEILSRGTVSAFHERLLTLGGSQPVGRAMLETFPLHHYSGGAEPGTRCYLDAYGFRLVSASGASVAYLSDHEPTEHTWATECHVLADTHLAVYDAHFADVPSQMYGHGSEEHAARAARQFPGVTILAGHHGPNFTDAAVLEAHVKYGAGAPNFAIAREGDRYAWDARNKRFTKG